MEAIKTVEIKNFKMEVYHQEFVESSPRTWFDSTFVCSDKFNLGDKSEISDEIKKVVINKHGEISQKFLRDHVCFPVYALIHGNMSISLKPFGCVFDSGIIGYIYVTKEMVRETYNKTRINKSLKNKLFNQFEQEMKLLTSWVNGEVYEIHVYKDGELYETMNSFYSIEEAEEEFKNIVGE